MQKNIIALLKIKDYCFGIHLKKGMDDHLVYTQVSIKYLFHCLDGIIFEEQNKIAWEKFLPIHLILKVVGNPLNWC